MRVRAASSDDVPALARLNAEVQALHRAALPDRYSDPSLAEVEDWMARLVADPEVTVLLAEAEGAAVGFAVVRRNQSAGHVFAYPRLSAMVDAVGVTAAAQRRGAGRALMAAAEEVARGWGAAAVLLDVQGFNQDARRFYQALGYATVTYRMSKPL